MKIKKILSLTTVTALILSLFCNIPAFVSAEPTDGCYIDFSQYKFEPLTKDIYDNYKSEYPEKTPTGGNMYDVNIYNGTKVGTYSLVEDSEASGGKYLNYVKERGGNNGGLDNYTFVANPTGNYSTTGGDYHTVLNGGGTYSMKIRYKVENLDSENYNLNLFTAVTASVATPNAPQNLSYVKKGIVNTQGWVEETYSFTAPATTEGKCNSLLIGFNPFKNGSSSRPDEGTDYTFDISVDYIEIAAVQFAPQHMEINFDNYKIKAVENNNGSIANDKENALWVLGEADGNKYMSYPSTGEMTNGGSIPYGFMANPTGSGSYADRENAFILGNGAEYRISFKYRLSEPSQDGTLTFKVGATGVSNCMNGWSGANTGIVLYPLEGTESTKLSASEDWKTVSYTFTMSTSNASARCSMQVAFVPDQVQRTVKYTLDVDDIVVDRLASVTIIDENGNQTVQKGAPATPTDGRTGFGGNTADAVVFDTSENTEVYTRPTAECVERTEYYYDSAMTRPITSMIFSASDATVYSKKILRQSSVNQVAFCGFDGRIMYRSSVGWVNYTFSGNSCYSNGTDEQVWSIVETESYTGSKSMRMALSDKFADSRKYLYIGNGYEYKDNVTYHISLRIKKDSSAEQNGDLKITLGGGGDVYGRFISGGDSSVITVPADSLSDEWTEYTLPITFVPQTIDTFPDYDEDYYRGPTLKFDTDSNVAVFLDSITISTVCGSVSGELTDADANDNKQELRITSSYTDDKNGKVVLAGTPYDIIERGILAKSSTNTAELNKGNEGVLSVEKTDNFDDYWADGANGEKIFSMLIENISEYDRRPVTARAYVKLSDGRTYYSPETVITAADNAPQGYSLVWGDEFDGTKLDTSKWSVAGTDTYDSTNSLVYYANNSKNVSVKNGLLQMKLEHRGSSNYTYKYNAPAGLTTKDTANFKYGYIEMRARIPYKNGIQSSFWFKTDGALAANTSDTSAEVDMIETFGLTDTVTPNIHKWYPAEDATLHTQYNSNGRTAKIKKFDSASLSDEFHIYGMEWTEKEIIMYVDRKEYARFDITKDYETEGEAIGSMDAFNNPMRLIIGISPYLSELGHWDFTGDGSGYTTANTDFSQSYSIDWVRLYQKDGCDLRTK